MPTSTPTITPTPTPTTPGGALILYTAVKEPNYELHCGVARADGAVLVDELLIRFSGSSIFTNDGTFYSPKYCPPGSNINTWSPDMQRFVFYVRSNQDFGQRLYLGRAGSSHYLLLVDFDTGGDPWWREPTVHWLGNDTIWYFDEGLQVTNFIQVNTKKTTTFDKQVTSSSPDGKTITYLDGETLYVMPFGGEKMINLDEAAQEKGVNIYYKDRLVQWSPDSEKFALYSKKDGHSTWAIFNKDGTFQTLVGDEPKGYYISLTWSPSSEHLLVNCDLVRVGEYAKKNLCLYNLKGELENKFPWQDYRNSDAYLTRDEQYIYYLLADAPPGLATTDFSARLVRIEVKTGEEQIMGEGMNDISWINSSDFWDIYIEEGAAIRESPDGTFFVFNNIGSFIELLQRPRTNDPKMLYTVFCSEYSGCKNFKLGELNVVGAAWWTPPLEWKP